MKKYSAHLLDKEINGHSFLVCLAHPPTLPEDVQLSDEVEPLAVLLMHRTENGFRWTAFSGDVADWKEPIGQLLIDEEIPVGKWVWMELRTDAQQKDSTTELATLRANAHNPDDKHQLSVAEYDQEMEANVKQVEEWKRKAEAYDKGV